MAEKHRVSGTSPERTAMVSSDSSSRELSSSGSDLHPLPVGRLASSSLTPNNLSSITVPVRLDVLYFLINSAAKGAQYALPQATTHCAPGLFSTCPAAQPPVNCCTQCSCHSAPTSAGFQQQLPCSYQGGSSHRTFVGHGGLNAGAKENQIAGQHLSTFARRSDDGNSWSGPGQSNSAVGWKRAESSVGCRENRRGEEGGRGNGGSWQGKWQNARRSWGNRRQDAVESSSWRSGSQSWKRGGPLGTNSGNSRRNQEGSHTWMPWDIPEAKRSLHGDTRREQQGGQAKRESTGISGVSGDVGVVITEAQEAEDWEVDYENKQDTSTTSARVSHATPPVAQSDTAKASEGWGRECAPPPTSLPKVECVNSPLPEPAGKIQAPVVERKQAAVSSVDWSKNGGFVKYLRNLFPDQPRKAESESSLELVIDEDRESSKPSEEEQSVEDGAAPEEPALLE